MESDSIVIVQFSVLHGDPRETSCLAHCGVYSFWNTDSICVRDMDCVD